MDSSQPLKTVRSETGSSTAAEASAPLASPFDVVGVLAEANVFITSRVHDELQKAVGKRGGEFAGLELEARFCAFKSASGTRPKRETAGELQSKSEKYTTHIGVDRASFKKLGDALAVKYAQAGVTHPPTIVTRDEKKGGDLRISRSESGLFKGAIKKRRLFALDFLLPQMPYDLRIALSSEDLVVVDDKIKDEKPGKETRLKRRTSWEFPLTAVTFDLTTVEAGAVTREVEIECKARGSDGLSKPDVAHLVDCALGLLSVLPPVG